MKSKEKFIRKLVELETYEERIPLYNLIGSEGDHNTRTLVDNALKQLGDAIKKTCKLCANEESLLFCSNCTCYICRDCAMYEQSMDIHRCPNCHDELEYMKE